MKIYNHAAKKDRVHPFLANALFQAPNDKSLSCFISSDVSEFPQKTEENMKKKVHCMDRFQRDWYVVRGCSAAIAASFAGIPDTRCSAI